MPTTEDAAGPIHWEETGTGEPVVLLHGLGGDAGFWAADVASWAGDLTCLALDLRGSGATPGSATGFGMDDLADDVVAVLDHRGLERAHVVGFSLGGLVAQALGVRHPQRVDRLVLASTYACMNTRARLFLDAVLAGYERDRSARQMFALICPWLFSTAFVDDPANAAWFDLPPEAEEDQSLEDWRALYRAQQAFDVRTELSRISAPTLVVAGDEDALVSVGDARRLLDGIPGATFELIGGAGHLVNVEQPARFHEVVRDFLLRR